MDRPRQPVDRCGWKCCLQRVLDGWTRSRGEKRPSGALQHLADSHHLIDGLPIAKHHLRKALNERPRVVNLGVREVFHGKTT